MRYSVAKAYDMKKWGKESGFLPGMGIKWYRDGIQSANLVAMPGFVATETPNFFENNFNNHIKPTNDDLSLKVLAHLFANGSPWATSIGLKDWAEFDKSGKKSSPNMPFQIVYEPQVKIDATIPPSKSFDDSIVETLTKKGELLWKVLAVEGPDDCANKKPAVHIGNIYSEGAAIKSVFADKNVMFSHNDMALDIDMNPSWGEKLASFLKPELNIFDLRKNDNEMYNKYGPAATAGCPYIAMMNMLQ